VAQDDRIDLLQGTLDMLILRTLLLKPAHGHTIARSIEQTSEDVLQVDHGSLYPALHRLQRRGWIASEWGASENNRRAKYYKLTAAGRKQLASETSKWKRMAGAIGRILKQAREGAKS
jgi:PadR family transcriptional regulator PadR